MNRDINSYNHGYFIQYRMDIIFFKAYIFKYSLTKKPSFLPNSEFLVLLILEFPFNTKSFVCLVKVHIHGKMARTVLQFFQTFLWNLFSHTFALYGFNHIVKITILNQLTLPIDKGGIFALKRLKTEVQDSEICPTDNKNFIETHFWIYWASKVVLEGYQ